MRNVLIYCKGSDMHVGMCVGMCVSALPNRLTPGGGEMTTYRKFLHQNFFDDLEKLRASYSGLIHDL